LGILKGHDAPVNRIIQYTPATILSTSKDNTLKLWDKASREEIVDFKTDCVKN
jgi:WD40 repeat protein